MEDLILDLLTTNGLISPIFLKTSSKNRQEFLQTRFGVFGPNRVAAEGNGKMDFFGV